MKIKKWFGCMSLVLVLACALPRVCYAKTTYFGNMFVDSNEYTWVASETKDTATKTARVYLTDIFKPGGEASNYTKVYAKAESGPETLVKKGTWVELPFSESQIMYYLAGANISIYCKGHNPSLDCEVSGNWDVY